MKSLGILLQETFQRKTELNEMANVSKNTTGLNVCIWILSEIPVEHNLPRIKFQNNYGNKVQPHSMIPMSISDNPQILIKNIKLGITTQDFEKIRSWVIPNKDLLLCYWNYDATIEDLIKEIKQV